MVCGRFGCGHLVCVRFDRHAVVHSKTYIEYSSEEYKHSIRKFSTTVDVDKYIRSKITSEQMTAVLKTILTSDSSPKNHSDK